MQDFQFIPVIDLMGGQVVQAAGGNRANYQSLKSPLTPSTDPANIAIALIELSQSKQLYIADLDSIQNEGANEKTIHRILEALPKIRLWIDPGIRKIEQALTWLDNSSVDLVIGSETLDDMEGFAKLISRQEARTILSLDFKNQEFMGNDVLLKSPNQWPPRIIVMSLDKVGSQLGPDLDILDRIIANAEQQSVYAAGGVRTMKDAETLHQKGASGALLSRAFHSASITQKEIAAFHQKRRSIL